MATSGMHLILVDVEVLHGSRHGVTITCCGTILLTVVRSPLLVMHDACSCENDYSMPSDQNGMRLGTWCFVLNFLLVPRWMA